MKSSADYPNVFTIILNWNGREDTLECLESVSRLKYPKNSVVVVDNGSTDGSVPAIRSAYPSVTIIENEENLGFTGGNNIALRYAMEHGADYMWLLNNDTVVEAAALDRIVSTAESSPDIGLVSPIIYFYDTPEKLQFEGKLVDWKRHAITDIPGGTDIHDREVQENISLWGTALLIKRAAVEKIGYLNDKYFAYYEDEDYSIRVLKGGFRNVVEPASKIYHKDARATGGYSSPMQAFLRSRNLYFLWMDKLNGVNRLRYFGRYLDQVINYGAYLQENDLVESVDASLAGVWSAIRGVGGPRDKKIKMPVLFRIIFLKIFFSHPYFWGSLLSGEPEKIFSEAKRRVRERGKTNLL